MTVNPLTPWIESLDACNTPQDFAMWLLAAPYSQLMTYEFAIRNRLRTKGYHYGVDYLDEVLGALRRERCRGEMTADFMADFEEQLDAVANGESDTAEG